MDLSVQLSELSALVVKLKVFRGALYFIEITFISTRLLADACPSNWGVR
jgi:hypothetical protein